MAAPPEDDTPPSYDSPVRSVAVHHVRASLRGAERHGVDVTVLLERAGIPAQLLEVPLARVSPRQFARLTQAVWQALDDELQGLGPGPLKVGTFAMMCHAVVHCSPDLRTALNRASAFYGLFPGGPRFQLEEEPGELGQETGEARVVFDLTGFDDPDHYLAESATVVAHRFAGWLIRRRIDLTRVEFSHPAPPHSLEYDLLYGAPCTFLAPRTALVLDRAILDRPVLQDEAGLRAFLRRAPGDVLARRDYGDTTAAQVRRLLGQSLPDRMPDPQEVAARLAVSTQTLRRRLAAEGTSFQRIRDQLRRDVAIAALATGAVSIEEISRQVGFSEPSAFHRAFKRWTGSAPRAYQPGG
ncbi:AraC family transcriptional regulator [Streptomyces pseudovenezuelae]|uniref:AraC-like DNA-binding protein n=1 Tax=Streptomyces pseudovenezuelae TaxID=67350 RepID=A0ABT6L9N0_9ACTN|nr:AraC family transcriptional regulator [Streptomyces pseudovenezuelae]MDH6213022.1 AraC-like DNA-binding protein [Streptomyces pseudovenezuelae]